MKTDGVYCFAQKEIIELPRSGKSGLSVHDMVIFVNKEGREEAGRVVYLDRESVDESKVLAEGALLRKMTPRDIQIMESNLARGKDVVRPAREKVEKHGLDMQIFDAAYSFDGSRINFIFTADDRVDFRELVKDLAKHFQKQIHLKQIGPRDKAKLVSGIGRCGRCLCCSSFLNKLESITMDMVRCQGLTSKGSSKLSGSCGKLLCCLKYEVEEYRRLRADLPPFGSIVKTSEYEGRVVGLDILNQKLKLQIAERNVITCAASDVKRVIVLEEKEGVGGVIAEGASTGHEETSSEDELVLKE